MNGQGPRYLIVGPAWVGDMVMAQSLFIALRQQHPECLIDVLAPGWSLPLLARMPEVNRAIEIPLRHGEFGLMPRWHLGRTLCAERYDRAIVLPRSFKAALIPFFAGTRVRTGYRGEMRYGLLNDIRALDKQLLTQTVQRYVALGLERDAPLPPPIHEPSLQVDTDNQQVLVHRLGLSLNHPVVALLPGAEYGPSKQWPLQHYAMLAKLLLEGGYQIWILGSDKDREAGEAIIDGRQGNVHNLCGQTHLVDTVDLLALCHAVVSNDSGLMHIAASVGTPLVAIYGSSTPAYTPPLSDKAKSVYLGLDCSPCFKRNCPLGHTNCLTDISPEAIMGQLQSLHSQSQTENTRED